MTTTTSTLEITTEPQPGRYQARVVVRGLSPYLGQQSATRNLVAAYAEARRVWTEAHPETKITDLKAAPLFNGMAVVVSAVEIECPEEA